MILVYFKSTQQLCFVFIVLTPSGRNDMLCVLGCLHGVIFLYIYKKYYFIYYTKRNIFCLQMIKQSF